MDALRHLPKLPAGTLEDLGRALRTGRWGRPTSALAIKHAVPSVTATAAEELAQALAAGLGPAHAVMLLDGLAATRRSAAQEPSIEIVTSGPDAIGTTRDTAVVMRELFRAAERRVLVVGYAVHKGRRLFETLAQRMTERPSLKVRLCLDISRPPGGGSCETAITRDFADRFVTREWPDARLPEVFYDPRALAAADRSRTSLHAKCVVVDGHSALVGSANLTEAAQLRNIELGLVVSSKAVAAGIEQHFQALIARGFLRKLTISRDTSRDHPAA